MDVKIILTEFLVGAMGLILFLQIIFAQNLQWRISSFSIFLLFLIFAYYLVKSVHEEERRREEAERLAQKERELAEKYQVLAIRLMAVEKQLRKLAERERKLRENAERLAQRERKLRMETERLARARDQFILSSQHYFRTPLTSILGYLENIKEGIYGEIPPLVLEKLNNMTFATKELSKRLEELLTISSFQLKRFDLEKKETQFEELLKELFQIFKIQAEVKKLKFELNLPKNPLPKIKIDKERMKEALSNLIDNAFKHTIKGGVSLFLKEIPEKKRILFWVKDSGIGIPKEELPLIGQIPFERGKEAKKLSLLGKGLGVYLSRLIIEAHQGKLWAESEGLGKGATFYVELPIE
jgi:signal transduction histidine kinase